MLTSDRITPRPTPKKISEPERTTRIEEIGARLAELRGQFDALDGASIAIAQLPEDTARRSEPHVALSQN